MKQLITASAVSPIDIGRLKGHLHVDDSELDVQLEEYIAGAVSEFEDETGMVLSLSTWEHAQDSWPCGTDLRLGVKPLQTVESVRYYTADGSEHTFAAECYEVDLQHALIRLKRGYSWPMDELRVASGVVVQFTAGYDGSEALPGDIRIALWFRVQSMAFGSSSSQSTVMAMEDRRLMSIFDRAVERYRIYL